MHLRVGSISEAEEVILIWFFVKPFQKERKPCKFIIYFVTSFVLVHISFDELFARQLKKIGCTELAFLQNKSHRHGLLF